MYTVTGVNDTVIDSWNDPFTVPSIWMQEGYILSLMSFSSGYQ